MSDLVQEDPIELKGEPVIERHHLCWHGIHITIEYEPDWSTVMVDHYGSSRAHIAVMSQDKVQLPITDTGYRSEFQFSKDIEEAGGVVVFVRSWLDAAGEDPKWIEHVDLSRQIELF